MKGVYGEFATVQVGTPSPEYFLRANRKSSLKIPHAQWTLRGDVKDCVCLSCFVKFKSARDGQFQLKKHAEQCYGKDYCDSLDLEGTMKSTDRRRHAPDDLEHFSYEDEMGNHVLTSRWIASSGRASCIVDDDGYVFVLAT